ncbi:hypothetical protein TNCV_4781631 [Trichonephila clavipes]|nr:hypothetical protein TNCV_4781631 [Trichonephila clavipes]
MFPHKPHSYSKEFGTVIEENDDSNADSEKELSLEQKLELVISKKIQHTKIQYRNQLCPKPSDDLFEDESFRDLEKL